MLHLNQKYLKSGRKWLSYGQVTHGRLREQHQDQCSFQETPSGLFWPLLAFTWCLDCLKSPPDKVFLDLSIYKILQVLLGICKYLFFCRCSKILIYWESSCTSQCVMTVRQARLFKNYTYLQLALYDDAPLTCITRYFWTLSQRSWPLKRTLKNFLSLLSPFQNLKKLVLFGCQAYLLNWWKIGPKAGLSASLQAFRRKMFLAKYACLVEPHIY